MLGKTCKDLFHTSILPKRSSQEICNVILNDISLDKEIPIPVYSIKIGCLAIKIQQHLHSENFWYEPTLHLLHNKYFGQKLKLRKKLIQSVPRKDVANVYFMYGSEENFVNAKIYPNVPYGEFRPNCSSISLLQKRSSTSQAALIGFFGSGNHMMR